MQAEIISIGTELLLGHILNTNTAFLSRKLAESGIDVYNTSVVGDNPQRLAGALAQALARSDVVITTGGLGPTVDDVTIETITKFIGKKTGIKLIRNRVGTAPGLVIDHKGKVIVCLPGPPRELEPMFENDIIPYISRARLNVPCADNGRSWTIRSRTIRITGLAESQVNGLVKDLLELRPPTTVGIYAKLGETELKIMTKAKNAKLAAVAIGRIEKKIRAKLKNFIFGNDDDTLESAVGKLLAKKKRTIAIAESCTGGLLSNRITGISGSSKYFIVGLVAYSDTIKEDILGVSKDTLKKYGAVSKEVAIEMALRIKLLAGTYVGVGITGIAGPTGYTRSKPVGLVYISFVTDSKRIVKELRFKGLREEIKYQASQSALDLIRKNI